MDVVDNKQYDGVCAVLYPLLEAGPVLIRSKTEIRDLDLLSIHYLRKTPELCMGIVIDPTKAPPGVYNGYLNEWVDYDRVKGIHESVGDIYIFLSDFSPMERHFRPLDKMLLHRIHVIVKDYYAGFKKTLDVDFYDSDNDDDRPPDAHHSDKKRHINSATK
jgi:hypothetical protein